MAKKSRKEAQENILRAAEVKEGLDSAAENSADTDANVPAASSANAMPDRESKPSDGSSREEKSENSVPANAAHHTAAVVPPPPVLKVIPESAPPTESASVQAPAPSQTPQLTITSKAASVKPDSQVKKFPSIAPSAAGSASPVQSPLIGGDEPPIKRYTPSGGYYVECFLREVVTNIRRNPMMSIASISTVMVLALILGLFTLVVANLDKLANELAGEMQLKVYMSSTFPAEEANDCQARLLKIEHVAGAKFIPKDAAFANLRKRLGGRINLEDLEHNPLPDAFQVPVDDPQYLEQVAQKIYEIKSVDKVDYGREEASKLLALNKAVRTVGFIILILLLASTVLIVSNTIRLTVFARRKEIDIMQLVGAADWFIRWPFILEGVAQGFIGAGLSALALDIGYRMVVPHFQHSIAFIPIIAPNEIMPYLCLGLAFMGCAVGALGSLISVNRYLKA